MIRGISLNGRHSYYGYGLRMLRQNIGSPEKDSVLERVPYSNITYDFSSIYGRSYGERTLEYRFEFVELCYEYAAERIAQVINWLHFDGRAELYDDCFPGWHFRVREPETQWSNEHGIVTFDITFKAEPAMLPNPQKQRYNVSNTLLPDVNRDGFVDSDDATEILRGYSELITGGDPGWTQLQRAAADADGDGFADAFDASMVLDFYAKLSTNEYRGMTLEQAWAAYLNERDNGSSSGEVY